MKALFFCRTFLVGRKRLVERKNSMIPFCLSNNFLALNFEYREFKMTHLCIFAKNSKFELHIVKNIGNKFNI